MIFFISGLAAFALEPDKKDSPAIWIQMNEGRLAAVLENDPDESIEIYNALLDDLSTQHPAYGELKFWLGRAQYMNGDKRTARESLQQALRSEKIRSSASAFFTEMSAWEKRVQTIPFAGNPWVDESGHSPSGPVSLWHASISSEASSFTELRLQASASVFSSLSITLIDWNNQRWIWRTDLKPGEHLLSVLVDQFSTAVSSTSPRFRAIEVSSLDAQGKISPIYIQELRLK